MQILEIFIEEKFESVDSDLDFHVFRINVVQDLNF